MAAVERLGLTQPSMTVALRRLEEQMKTSLFERNRKGVRLTRAGEKLAARAREFLREWETLFQEVRDEELKVRGVYRLGCHPSVAQYSLPKFLKGFMSDESELEIQLQHDLSRKITERVISKECDWGIVVNPVAHPDLVIKELAKDEVTLWKARHGANEDVLILEPELKQTEEILRKMKKYSFRRKIESSNLDVIRSLVEGGAGVGILPERVIGLQNKDVARWSKDAPIFQDRICLIYRLESRAWPATKALLRQLERVSI
jgi:DNA-binding transcriptional LysR family regulator